MVTPREQFSHTTPIAGLFLACQTTFPGYGVGAAMMSGIFAAEALEASWLPLSAAANLCLRTKHWNRPANLRCVPFAFISIAR